MGKSGAAGLRFCLSAQATWSILRQFCCEARTAYADLPEIKAAISFMASEASGNMGAMAG